MTKPVLAERSDGILSLTLNRPDKKNALNHDMYDLLRRGLDAAAADEAVRVVLLKANGDVFTAGNDLHDFAASEARMTDTENLPVLKFMHRLVDFDKPVIAAVHGRAVGIGCTLLLHCDLVVAGRSTIFSMPFTQLGVVPEFASSYLLPRLAGRARTSRVLLLGEPFDAEDACDMGIVSHVCEDSEIEEQVMDLCQKICALPARTLREVKRLLTPNKQRTEIKRVIGEEFKLFVQGLRSEEHREALAAFVEKRKPDFSKW